ncbi:aldo/keto reductase [Proteiniphilum sp. X52]|uniref:aldo/keto reductase n=1 Tax=Proteiniphilum sp. X52 TaxID=2382159 RepID=UPI000F09C530|nr:aldo/keto reductase [Proteiniphilum sp. X52]RNC63440.1 aldo/keto reductase [Proteiniphilum sp. X52]
MEKRRLGTIEVSPIGMGCMAFSHGYGEVPAEGYALEAIRRAYDYGCTFFDTAEAYGGQQFWPGHNEQLLGKAVKGFRKEVVLATKFHFGAVSFENDAQVEHIIREHISLSLKHLDTDYIDLYYLHRISRQIPVESVALSMGKLIREGIIRAWGLSQVSGETLRRAHEVTPVSAVQNIYSMVERDCEAEVFPYALQHGIGVVPFSPVASGLLSGRITAETDFSHSDDVRKFVPQLTRKNIEANEPLLAQLHDYADRKQATMAQVSLAWMLHKYPNVVPIPGSRNQERILENLGAWNVTLTDAEFAELEQTLDSIEIHGHRGIVEFEGDSMQQWNREK